MDDNFDDHPKVLAILDEMEGAATAIGLWALCFAYVNRNRRKGKGAPGFVPSGLPRRYFGSEAGVGVKLLVQHGLWDVSPADDGWFFHDFGDYLPTEKTREARSEAGKRGAEKRWAAKREAEASAQEIAEDGNLPSACHDVDSNAVANDGSRTPARRDPTPTPNPEGQEHMVTAARRPPADDLFDGFDGMAVLHEQSIAQTKAAKAAAEAAALARADAEFDAWWSGYPKKVARQPARKAWTGARKKVSAEVLTDGLARYVAHLRAEATPPRAIAHGATWLNESRWLDDYRPTVAPVSPIPRRVPPNERCPEHPTFNAATCGPCRADRLSSGGRQSA
ncbi:hypothetical protein [Catenuloplanes japonicus]|uniref:hypothetical protein n=1 Tax=Catenuloplanes japonicus TaxID=33876 RepID=UPI0012F84769|nr:hypothetical protein [Catenuloplanes japonicus]